MLAIRSVHYSSTFISQSEFLTGRNYLQATFTSARKTLDVRLYLLSACLPTQSSPPTKTIVGNQFLVIPAAALLTRPIRAFDHIHPRTHPYHVPRKVRKLIYDPAQPCLFHRLEVLLIGVDAVDQREAELDRYRIVVEQRYGLNHVSLELSLFVEVLHVSVAALEILVEPVKNYLLHARNHIFVGGDVGL